MKLLCLSVVLVAICACGPSGAPPSPAATGFIDRAREAGFVHPNHTGIFERREFLVETKGGGTICFDYDSDGDVDVYIVDGNRFELDADGRVVTKRAAPGAGNRLMRNDGDWRFTDVTESSGTGDDDFGIGGTVGDYDNDGKSDLFICNWGRNTLYRNNGDGTFSNVTEAAGVAGAENDFTTCATFLDMDLDGDLDLYVSNYGDNEKLMLATKGRPPGFTVPGAFKYSGPGVYEPQLDRLYRNDGDGAFTDVSATALVDQLASYAFQPITLDVDNDGDTDIFVANDSVPNFLWINDGTGRFTEMAEDAGCAVSEMATPSAGMGVDAEDYDQDGWLDIMLTNFSSDMNFLHRNLGGQGLLMFQHETARTGAAIGAWEKVSWGVALRDFNQDGVLDIFVATGHVYPSEDPALKNRAESYEQSPLLYFGNGAPDWDFRQATKEGGPGLAIRRLGRGAVFEDFDGDGDQDVLITCLNKIPLVLENRLPEMGNWVKVRLQGTKCNRDALGARVTVEAASGKINQMREMRFSSSFASSHNVYLHWGLGAAKKVDRLTIRWPGGEKEVFTDLPANSAYRIVEGSGVPEKIADRR